MNPSVEDEAVFEQGYLWFLSQGRVGELEMTVDVRYLGECANRVCFLSRSVECNGLVVCMVGLKPMCQKSESKTEVSDYCCKDRKMLLKRKADVGLRVRQTNFSEGVDAYRVNDWRD